MMLCSISKMQLFVDIQFPAIHGRFWMVKHDNYNFLSDIECMPYFFLRN